MSKLNITFKGKKYSIDKSLLSDVIASLETALVGLSGGGSDSNILPAGLYQTGAIALMSEGRQDEAVMITPWDELLANGTVHVEDGVVYVNFDEDTWENASSDALTGDLVLPNDGTITKIGNYREWYDEDGNWFYEGHVAFQECYNLTGIWIPNGVTSIGERAFCGCESLSNITIPDSVTSIGRNAFESCHNLVYNEYNNAVYLGNSENPYVVLLGAKSDDIMFCNINANTNLINAGAFSYCSSLESITIPESVTSIGVSAFECCTGLKSVTIGNGVTSIGDYAFCECENLKSVNIPESVMSIGAGAFAGCPSLTSINVSDSVTSIGDWAFANCPSLTNITFTGTIAQWDAIEKGEKWNQYAPATYVQCSDGQVPLNVTIAPGLYDANGVMLASWDELRFTYGMDATKNYKWNTYKTDSTSPYRVLTNRTALANGTTLIIGDISEIGNYAFSECPNLESITIGDSVTSIGECAFSYCERLASVTFGDSVTSIGGGAFEGCTSLASVTISDSVTSISNNAFLGCSSLTNITVDEGNAVYYSSGNCLIEIESQTLISGCNTSVIPDSVTSIGNYAFVDRTSLTNITIPDSVESIGDGAFSRCTSLTNITIPDSVTRIGWRAFYGCTSLESVTIGNGVTFIGESAFCGCESLTSITIPDSVTTIRGGAFEGCTNLMSATFENPNNWFIEQVANSGVGYNKTLTDASTNATYLTSTYCSYYWYRR